MILVDVNLLLYSTFPIYPEHPAARTWFENVLTGTNSVGLPWESLNAFLRMAISSKIYAQPLSVAEAWSNVEGWLSFSSVWSPAAGPRHREIFSGLISRRPLSSKDIPDAHLASLAIEYDLTLYSADQDFATYPDLKWRNPLIA